MTPEAKKILEDTYDVLEARGWCQGAMGKADGRVCLEGAFRAALGHENHFRRSLYETPDHTVAWDTLCGVVHKESEGRHFQPWTWNDEPERTVEDVKLLLKKAIES